MFKPFIKPRSRKLSEPNRGTMLGRLLPAILVLYDHADTPLALWFEESGTGGVLEDFADTFTCTGRALEVHAGTNLLCDGLTLKGTWKDHISISEIKEQ